MYNGDVIILKVASVDNTYRYPLSKAYYSAIYEMTTEEISSLMIKLIGSSASGRLLEMCPKTNHMMILYGHFTC